MKQNSELDKKLYIKFMNGDKESFNSIVVKYRSTLVSFVYKIINDLDIAEDIVQESFVYLYKTKKDYDFKYTLKTYLFTIAKSRAINYLKLNTIKEVPLEENNIVKEHNNGIDDYLIRKESKEHLLKNINSLKYEYKMVIYLREFEGFKYEEIAEILNKSIPQIKMLLYRARKSLKSKIVQNNNSIFRTIINFIIIILTITGVTYAGITAYKIIQKETKTNFNNYDYNEDMQYYDGIYYKKITTYQIYKKDWERWNELF